MEPMRRDVRQDDNVAGVFILIIQHESMRACAGKAYAPQPAGAAIVIPSGLGTQPEPTEGAARDPVR